MTRLGTMLAALLAGAVLLPASAEAQTRGGFEAGAQVTDYSYEERDAGETIVFDDGTFGGFHVGYTETIGGGMFLRARLSADFGSVDYRAPDPAGDVRLRNVSQSIGQLELHFGKDFRIGTGATVTAFAGLGSRVLNDESGGRVASDGALGYDREVAYAYVPLGLAARVPVSKRSAILVSAQYNWVVGGESKAHFSDVDPELPNLELDFNGGRGLEASAGFQTALGKHAVSIGPFVRHWKIDQSDSFIVTNPDDPTEAIEIYEPRNSTTELGLRMTFSF